MIQRNDDKATVICDGCHEVIRECGTMCQSDDGKEELHFCDECSSPANQEFRVCMVCGEPFIEGFTDGCTFYSCEDCFEQAMGDEFYSDWRERGDEGPNGGFYDAYEPRECRWYDTGVYWTTWYYEAGHGTQEAD